MNYEPPPQVIEWSWIWQKWIHGFWASQNQQFKLKATAQEITSSTTLEDDDDLIVNLEANGIYDIEAHIVWTSTSATPDVKYLFVEADGTWEGLATERDGTTNAVNNFTEATATRTLAIAANNTAKIHIRIIAKAGTSGGAFKLRWAQNTSNGTATICDKGNWIRARKL